MRSATYRDLREFGLQFVTPEEAEFRALVEEIQNRPDPLGRGGSDRGGRAGGGAFESEWEGDRRAGVRVETYRGRWPGAHETSFESGIEHADGCADGARESGERSI